MLGEPDVLPTFPVLLGEPGGHPVLPGMDGLEVVGDNMEEDGVLVEEELLGVLAEVCADEQDSVLVQGAVGVEEEVQGVHGAMGVEEELLRAHGAMGVEELLGVHGAMGVEELLGVHGVVGVEEELLCMHGAVSATEGIDLLAAPVPISSMQWVDELQPDFDQWMGDMDEGEEVVVEDGGEEEVVVEVGEEVEADEDVERSDDDSAATDPRAWTERLVNPADMVGYEHDETMYDWLARCRLTSRTSRVEEARTSLVEGEHKFDDLTAGENVIIDVLFDCYHPNIIRHDNGSYSYHEE